MVHALLGLTGGMGSGKSTVGTILRSLGAAVVDADQLAREVVEPGTAGLARVVERWGRRMLNGDGTLNRQAIGEIVFADRDQLKELEAILHPLIIAESDRRLAASNALIGVHMAALLLEGGAANRCDVIWVVSAPEEVRIARVLERDPSLDRAAIEARMSRQIPDNLKRRWADRVIENDCELDELEMRVKAEYAELVEAVAHDRLDTYRRAELRDAKA